VLTLAALPWVAAHRDPGGELLRLERAALSAAALDRAAAGVAEWLERGGIGPGHRVAVLCGNGLAFPPLYYGALRRGCVVAPVSTASPPAEVARTLRRTRARALGCDAENADAASAALRLAATGARRLLVADPGVPDAGALALDTLVEHPAADPAPLPAGAPAVILGTSGTTGTPRRALHSHAGLLLNAAAVAGEMLDLRPSDVQLGALPLAHSFGMSAVLNASMLAGAAVVLARRPDPAELHRLVAAEAVTVVQAVPTLLARLADTAARPWPAVRLCVVSGAPLPAGLPERIHDRLGGRLLERYGMTEASPLTVREVPPDGGMPGDVGLPLRGVMVRVAGGGAEGELEAAAPSMFLGYDGDRAATSAALGGGVLRTGDLGRVLDGGRVIVTGRLKEVIVRAGNNVPAREVEWLLETHPAVVEAAVVGVPDADLGEEVAAAVVLRPRAGESAVAELERLCHEQLAQYKRPRLWRVVDSLPRTASGKVRKAQVRELLLEGDAGG
jgi:long-chain acyl-CoA synthetase